ncbi:MAG: hypothetical protein BV456_01780 [Thermoplasmata archaeon M8B2D]|nr:MAG: hypothetical protein BV456_01780 [Thermoplasmata archaeon M8B2D]
MKKNKAKQISWFQVKRKDQPVENFHSPIKGCFSSPEKAWAFYCKNQEKYSWLDKRILVQEVYPIGSNPVFRDKEIIKI